MEIKVVKETDENDKKQKEVPENTKKQPNKTNKGKSAGSDKKK